MGKAECLENIQEKIPPIYCGDLVEGWCANIQGKINEQCEHSGLGGDVPVPQYNPATGEECWCCCSCFAYNTPILVDIDKFKFIQDIEMGETVLATNSDVSVWEPREVTDLGGIAPEVEMDFMFYASFMFDTANFEERHLITTADHLFLVPSENSKEGVLQPIKDLRPGDKVITADGGTATVSFAVPGKYSGGVRHISLGDYEGGPLDGHLLNSNGIVTADLSVQLHFYGGMVDSRLLAPDLKSGTPSLGSSKFYQQYNSAAMVEFINDRKLWPQGFEVNTQSLINIPVSAFSYFTEKQAEDIANNTDMLDYGNGAPISTADYLYTLYGAFPASAKTLFITDWMNDEPNAYFFRESKQTFTVITGGLLRIKGFDMDGLAILLSHMVANSEGTECTAAADYQGVLLNMRQVFRDSLFIKVIQAGMPQLEVLFNAISDENREGNPDDICFQPSIDCRIETINAAAASFDQPVCGLPLPGFRVVSAEASEDLSNVTVTFSKELNAKSVFNTGNYLFEPNVEVCSAKVVKDKPDTVILEVEEMKPDTMYFLEIINVKDSDGNVISPEGNTTEFTTSE